MSLPVPWQVDMSPRLIPSKGGENHSHNYVRSIFLHSERSQSAEACHYILYTNGQRQDRVSPDLIPQLSAIEKALAESQGRAQAQIELRLELATRRYNRTIGASRRRTQRPYPLSLKNSRPVIS